MGEFWEMVAVLGIGLPITVAFVALMGYLVADAHSNPSIRWPSGPPKLQLIICMAARNQQP